MTRHSRAPGLWAGVLVAAAIGLLTAQSTPPVATQPQTAPLNATLPVDPQIAVGQLPNGLKYYVRTNHAPERRAELRLVVNAGSVLEDDSQRGLAHLVEHMAFDGTTHFPGHDVIAFMQALGMQFGAHVNAHTSFDETVYQLTIPTGDASVIDRALLILQDWARDVSFDPDQLDKERRVVMEEWRLGRGADARLEDKQFPVLLAGSHYAERVPIGLPAVIQNATRDDIKRFYDDWYRPDLMAVIAVGDFDRSAVEGQIKLRFSGIPEPASPRPRPVYVVPDHPGTAYSIETDQEATGTEVAIYTLAPERDQSTLAAYRDQQVLDPLFTELLSDRFAELTQQQNAPFLEAGTERGPLVRTALATTLSAVVPDGGAPAGLRALVAETARVARFGFTETELQRAKDRLLHSVDRALVEKDTEPSVSFADEFTRSFTTGEPIPGIAYEAQLYHRFVPAVTVADVNAMAKAWAPDRDRVVVVSAPAKAGVKVPTEAELAAAIREADSLPLAPYVDTVAAAPLLERPPTGGAITKTTTDAALGMIEWQLSNGARVVLKPTTFKEDEIVMRAFAPGGTSLAADKDVIAAETAAEVVAAGGLGAFSGIDLQKKLAGSTAQAAPFIDETDQGLAGGGTRADLETLFQLIYLRFTAPRADANVFGVMTSQAKTMLADQSVTPDFAFSEALESALLQDQARGRMLTADRVASMNLDTSMAFYKQRFSDASNFTFVFVGSFTPDLLRPFVEQYIGGLPATHKNETWKDNGARPPASVVVKRVQKGIEPKSQVAIAFTGPFQYDPSHRVLLRAMAMVLEGHLLRTLREDLGGTYGVSASQAYERAPFPEYSVMIDFTCSPDRTDELVKRVFDEVAMFKARGPSASDIGDIRLALLRELETNSRSNAYVLREISQRLEEGEDVDDLLNLPDLYAAINIQSVWDAAKTYLDTTRYVQVTMFPEKP